VLWAYCVLLFLIMAATRVVRLRRKGGKVVQDCDVYIGRRLCMGGWNLAASKWANPFPVKDCASAEEAIAKFEAYLLASPKLIADLAELKGKTLGCWCKPGPCHGDVLAKLADSAP
jgi:Domain of unknown function (DUF4326)